VRAAGLAPRHHRDALSARRRSTGGPEPVSHAGPGACDLDEFLLFQAGLALQRRGAEAVRKPHVVAVDGRVREAAHKLVPFTLTDGQAAALAEILGDMARPHPMHRLLQGDVGAGKTMVALLAAVVAMENGLQAAFMAPTEILAEQHYLTIRRLFESAPYSVGVLTGSTPAAERRAVLDGLTDGTLQLLVGTHALVQQSVSFARLGLVVIDEQHRFGVMQRRSSGRRAGAPTCWS